MLKPLLNENDGNPEYQTFEEKIKRNQQSFFQSNFLHISRIKISIDGKMKTTIYNKQILKMKQNSTFQIKMFVVTNFSLQNYLVDCYVTKEDGEIEELSYIVTDQKQLLENEKKIILPKMKMKSKILKFLFFLKKGSEFSKFEFTIKSE